MAGGEFPNQAGYSRKLISGEGIRNDEHSAVGASIVEESNREPDEIIPVSGHQTSFLFSCKVELPLIRRLTHSDLMGTECVHSTSSKYFGNLRAEVFIQVTLHVGDLIKG